MENIRIDTTSKCLTNDQSNSLSTDGEHRVKPCTDKCIEDYKNYITYFTVSLPAEALELILMGDPFLVEDLD